MKLVQQKQIFAYYTSLVTLLVKMQTSLLSSPVEDIESNTIIVNFLEELKNSYTSMKYFYLHKQNFSPEVTSSGLPIYYDYLGLNHAEEQKAQIAAEILPKEQYINTIFDTILCQHMTPDSNTLRGLTKHFLLAALQLPRINLNSCEIVESADKVIISFSFISPLSQIPEKCIIHTTKIRPLTDEDKTIITNSINGTREIGDLSVMMFTLDEKCSFLIPNKALCFSLDGVYNEYCATTNEILANSNAAHCVIYKIQSIRSEKVSKIMHHSKDTIQVYENALQGAKKGEAKQVNIVFGDFATMQKIYDSDKSNNIIKNNLRKMAHDNSKKGGGIKIEYSDLIPYRSKAELTITGCKVMPSTQSIARIKEIFGNVLVFDDTSTVRKEESCNVYDSMISLRNRFLPNCITSSPNMALASYVLQESIAMGHYMNEEQKKVLGIDRKEAESEPGYDDKRMSAATIGMFSMASYAIFLLDKSPKIGGHDTTFTGDFQGIPELPINSFHSGLNYMAYFFDLYLKKKGLINSELELLGFMRTYFAAIQKDTAIRKDGLQADAIFENNNYMLDVPGYSESFRLEGWEIMSLTSGTYASAEFRRIDISKIAGNEDVLRLAERIAFIICSYDTKVKKNPWAKYGKPPLVLLFYGLPGGGKTLLARALATIIHDLCKKAGLKFAFLPFPTDSGDKYQGETAKKVKAWFKELQNDTCITFGFVDDAENLFADMGGSDASEAEKATTSVTLTSLDGSTSPETNNYIFMIATNNPEKLPAPLVNRVQVKREVKGPETSAEFVKIMKTSLDEYHKFDAKLVSSKDDKVLHPVSIRDQKIDFSDIESLNLDPRLLVIFKECINEGFTGEDLVGQICARFKERINKKLSGRDIANICAIVGQRVNDFDIRKEWLDNPSTFLHKTIEEKEALIEELMINHLKAIQYDKMVIYETLKYLQDVIVLGEFEHRKKIEKIVDDEMLFIEAKKVLAQKEKV